VDRLVDIISDSSPCASRSAAGAECLPIFPYIFFLEFPHLGHLLLFVLVALLVTWCILNCPTTEAFRVGLEKRLRPRSPMGGEECV